MKGPSYFTTGEGALALREMTYLLVAKGIEEYDRVVSIGRSGTCLLGYLAGLTSGGGTTRLTDLPFSFPNPSNAIKPGERVALRKHLARNGLDPESIAAAKRPILFYDFVYSAVSAYVLLKEISMWATELEIKAAVKKNIHFIGFFPALTKARDVLNGIHLASNKEQGGATSSGPSEREIQDLAEGLTSKHFDDIKALVGKATEPHVHPDFYNYLATHAPNAHDSLHHEAEEEGVSRIHWEKDLSALPENIMQGKAAQDGHLELYFLFKEGELDRVAGCSRLLPQPQVAATLSKLLKALER